MLQQPMPSLPATETELAGGTRLLQGQYQIEQPLIAGGFGITYLARDSLDRQVVIKECFPAEVCLREEGQVRPRGPAQLRAFRAVLRSFLREAHLLARAVHPNIVPVHQVFRENGTGYIAMDFIDGLDLLALRETQSDRLTAEMRQGCLTQALEALEALHGLGILHRDIAPDNLIWTRDNRLMLIDFGAACTERVEDQGTAEGAMAVKDGYSPHELYQRGAIARPATDLYALGATMVFLLTGEAPPPGPERLAAVTCGEIDPLMHLLPDNRPDAPLWRTVEKALSVLPGARYQTAAEWLADLPPPPRVTIQSYAPADGPPLAAPAQVAPACEAPAVATDSDLPPAQEPQLDARIAALVAETNDTIAPGLPRTLQQEAEPTAQPEQTLRQFVDLFGQPVSDLQAWLADQDSPPTRGQPSEHGARGTSRSPAPGAAAPNAGDAPQSPPARRGLKGLFRPRSTAR